MFWKQGWSAYISLHLIISFKKLQRRSSEFTNFCSVYCEITEIDLSNKVQSILLCLQHIISYYMFILEFANISVVFNIWGLFAEFMDSPYYSEL
jgi:hypothetical protein